MLKHGKEYSIAKHLGLLYADLDRWLQSVVTQQQTLRVRLEELAREEREQEEREQEEREQEEQAREEREQEEQAQVERQRLQEEAHQTSQKRAKLEELQVRLEVMKIGNQRGSHFVRWSHLLSST